MDQRPHLNLFARLASVLRLERDWALLGVAAVLGVVMAGVATAFILPLRWIEDWAAGAPRSMLIWMVPLMPIIGALLTGIVLRVLGEQTMPGISAVLLSIHRGRARLDLRIAAGKWIASTFTIGSGGSAGPEGPIVTIGSVIGSNFARLFRDNAQHRFTLLGCGAAAGIASVFNAPFAGIFFALEVLLRDFSMRTFTPVVIAAVMSVAWTQTMVGGDALFAREGGFSKELFSTIELPNYLIMGVVCGCAAAMFIRMLSFTEHLFDRMRVPGMIKPAIGAALLGLLGLAWMLSTHTPHGMPEFYGSGYPAVRDLLTPAFYYGSQATALRPGYLLLLIVMIGVTKSLATCLTIGSGGSGGLFAPSLLMGASVGGTFGYLVNALGWFPSATPAHYALVGMAAMLAGAAHAPLTGILLVYELTQNYSIILPLMLATVISTIVARLVHPDSVYTVKLTQMGVRTGAMSDLTILRRLSVNDVPLLSAVTVHQDHSAQDLLVLSEQHMVRDFVVVDGEHRYVGMVVGPDIAAALVYREAIPLLTVRELMRCDLPTVSRDETLDRVLDKFSRTDAHSLVVLQAAPSQQLIGLITRSHLMERYQAALQERH